MTKEQWAVIVSLIAMLLIASSYFFKKKSYYLALQGAGMVFLMASYLCTGEYFAMIGLAIGLARALCYFAFEIHDKNASIFFPLLFSGLSIVAYFIINFWILKTTKPADIIYLLGLVGYAFIFWIRDLKTVRYLVTIPTTLSILYNVLIRAVPFVVISYSFELLANLVSIAKYDLFKKKSNLPSEETEHEKH